MFHSQHVFNGSNFFSRHIIRCAGRWFLLSTFQLVSWWRKPSFGMNIFFISSISLNENIQLYASLKSTNWRIRSQRSCRAVQMRRMAKVNGSWSWNLSIDDFILIIGHQQLRFSTNNQHTKQIDTPASFHLLLKCIQFSSSSIKNKSKPTHAHETSKWENGKNS